MQLQDLRAVNKALAAKRHQIRLLIAPLAQRRRPFVRPAQVEHLLAGHDDCAVDLPRDERRDLLCDHRDHRLVEQGQSLGGSAHADQRHALTQPPQRHQIRIAETGTQLGGPTECGVCAPGIARVHAPRRHRDQQVSPLHAVQLVVVQQPLCPGEPAAGAGHLLSVDQPEDQPERSPDSPHHLPPVKQLPVRPLPRRGGGLVLTNQVRSDRKSLEILRRQRRIAIRRRQPCESVAPERALEGHTTPI